MTLTDLRFNPETTWIDILHMHMHRLKLHVLLFHVRQPYAHKHFPKIVFVSHKPRGENTFPEFYKVPCITVLNPDGIQVGTLSDNVLSTPMH